jgi:hypothetical protein
MTRYYPVDASGDTNLCLNQLVRYAEQYLHRTVWWLVTSDWNGSKWQVNDPDEPDYVLAFAEREGSK